MKFSLLISVASLFASLFWGCGERGGRVYEEEKPQQGKEVSLLSDNDITHEAMRKADSVLNMLTLEERVGQCFMPSMLTRVDEENIEKLRRYVSDYHVGGIVLLRGDMKSAAKMVEECGRSRVPLLIGIDAEWGLGMRLEDAPGFPRNGQIDSSADEQLLYDYGREVGRECRRLGINMVLGPVVDVVENTEGVIGDRSFGSDPERVADLGVAYARGLESGGVLSVAKHFPGHGGSDGDSHHILPVVERSRVELDSIDLYPFTTYIGASLSGIMVGHLAVPSVDSLMLPAAVSEAVVDGLLRRDLGFEGLVLTDALNMGGAAGYGADDALKAGADIVVGPDDTGAEIRNVIEKVKKREIKISTVDNHCRRILFYKFLAGLVRERRIELEGLMEDVKGDSDSLRFRLS